MTWDRLRSSYDAVASSYDARFRDELHGKPRDRELLQSFAGSVTDVVVDVGCGPGQVGAFVRQRGRRVVGVDLSPEMAKLAASRLDAALAADMRALPFPTGALGGLLAFYALIHVRRPELGIVLREFHRVLRPGGRVLFSAHEGHGEIEVQEFLDHPVPLAATFFALKELVIASRAAEFDVRLAERRAPYPAEHQTVRLYVEAERTEPGP